MQFHLTQFFASLAIFMKKIKRLACVGIQKVNVRSILFETKAKRSLLSGYSVENADFSK